MAIKIEPWDQIAVFHIRFQRRVPLILLVVLLASCDDSKQNADSAVPSENSPRRSRSERASREAFGTRDSFRNDITEARKLISTKERDKNLAEIAWKTLESEPEIASVAIQEISSGSEEKKLLIEAYIQILLARERSEEAELWADSLGNDIDTQAGLSKIEDLLGYSNPEQDALALSELDLVGEVNPVAEQVIRNWSARNPSKAAEWLRTMPREEARANGFRVLIEGWLARDPSRAFSWASSQTDPQFRQEAMTGMVGFLNDQPAPIRDSLLEGADQTVRGEILQRIDEISPPFKNGDDPEAEDIAPLETEAPAER